MLTKEIIREIEKIIEKSEGVRISVQKVKSLSGGDINMAYELISDHDSFFVKIHSSQLYPDLFESESKGLQLLRSTNTIRIPQIIGTGHADKKSFLILEMIKPGAKKKDYWPDAGRALAGLHLNTHVFHGLDHHNYIGSLQQINNRHKSGAEFMIRQRFQPMISSAFKKNLLSTTDLAKFELLYKKLPELLPDESRSLLHGDLWCGNMITGPEGDTRFIDPAVYFGYRETDLAMTKLFGGFDDTFYEGYIEVYPLRDGWEERVLLFQIYPLLVHLNLFGGGYKNAVMEAVEKFR